MSEDELKGMVKAVLNCDPEEFYKRYKKYKKAEAEFKELYEPFKEGFIKLYDNHKDMPSSVVIGGAKITYVSPSIRTSIDSKKLKEEEPELAKKYTKTTNVAATIRLDEV